MVESKRQCPLGGGTRLKGAIVVLLAALLFLPAFGAARAFDAEKDKEPPKELSATRSARALSSLEERPTPEALAKAERVTLEDAVAIVRQAHGGRLVSAKSVRRPKSGYRIRIDVDGRVKSLFVDAQGRMSVQ